MMRPSRPQSADGFSLLEMAIVIAIVSIIAAAGIGIASGALKAADRVTTQERLNTIKLALDSHARTYGYLPCPARRDLTPTDASYGVESRAATSATGAACTVAAGMSTTASVVFGAVPVRTLGLPDSYAGDAWGNKLTYAVSDNAVQAPDRLTTTDGVIIVKAGVSSGTNYTLTNQRKTLSYNSVVNNGSGLAQLTFSPPSTGTLANGMIVHAVGSVYKGSFTVANLSASTIDLTGSTFSASDTGSVFWQEPGAAATYVVVSHGPDGRGAYPTAGTGVPAVKLCTGVAANTSPPPCTSSATVDCIDIQNCNDSDAIFYDTIYNDGKVSAEYFDDYIVWGSNANARAAANNTLYTGTSHGCPTGTCELWCAACSANYPGAGSSSIPASGITSGAILCRKVLTSNSISCAATCFWGGSGSNGFQKCL